MTRTMMSAALAITILMPAFAEAQSVTVVLTADQATPAAPVCVPLSVPKSAAAFRHAIIAGGPGFIPGQLAAPSLTTESIKPRADDFVRRDLWLLAPALKAGEKLTLTAKLMDHDASPDPTGFVWHDFFEGKPAELVHSVLGGMKHRPVLRYMAAPFDDTSDAARERTYKVFHHLFDPDGKIIVTNGGQADLKPGESRKLTFPHHRGLMFGFNKCGYGDGLQLKADTWHCPPKGPLYAFVQHEKVLGKDSGAVLGRHRVQIGWHGAKKAKFAVEERELTAYELPGGTLVEFAARLRPVAGPVKLDGDPQHAGFQFRASNDVAEKTSKETYYLHPDGKGEPGKERNWPQDKALVDLPWYCMSFVLDGQRYTACLLNHPKNPKETRFSERAYGRFGGYFEYLVTEQAPLLVNYRLWLQKGEMTAAQAQGLYDAFARGAQGTTK